MKKVFSNWKIFVAIILAFTVTGCVKQPKFPAPTALELPTPILDNSGKYMFPYTQDEVLAEWTDKAIAAEGASSVGGAVGAYAGAKALEQVPFIGGFLGQKAGAAIGRQVVLSNAGGMEFIKESSDISFNTVQDYCVYAYAKYAVNKHYASAMKAAKAIYTDMKDPVCTQAIYRAKRKVVVAAPVAATTATPAQ